MQPPLPPQTQLQDRYRILSTIGQGGFGRTYLAEDSARFQERCAIKEFAPQNSDPALLAKSKELFQREAEILYQLRHPQIPQFQAIFEENGRLFLAREYVNGQTYRQLLDIRCQQGQAFSEAEVTQLLQQFLPVLDYIHTQGIIHRDLSPDNLIQRQSDGLPIPIDFGVVKEIATQIQAEDAPHDAAPPTLVGKPGYAPSEQLQTGRAYPHSDLYALAVTAIELLTGRPPRDLYDDRGSGWNWQRLVSVSPGLAQVLNRMLVDRPGDRYLTAREALAALSSNATPPAVTPAPNPTPNPASDASQMQTVAVGRPLDSSQTTQAHTAPASPSPTPNDARDARPSIEPRSSTIWDNPAVVTVVLAVVALLAGWSAWTLIGALAGGGDRPSGAPDPVAEQPLEVPTTTPTPEPEIIDRRLNLTPGNTVTVEGRITARETYNYRVQGNAGDELSAFLDGEGVLMTVFDPFGRPVSQRSQRVSGWDGTLPTEGEYTLQLQPVSGISDARFSLDVRLTAAEPEPTPTPTPEPTPTPTPEPTPTPTPEPTPTPTPEPTPTPTPEPTPTPTTTPVPELTPQLLQFPPGQNDVQVRDRVSPQQMRRYLVPVDARQVFTVELFPVGGQGGEVTFTVRRPDGQPMAGTQNVVFWQSRVGQGGRYQIDVSSSVAREFELSVNVRN